MSMWKCFLLAASGRICGVKSHFPYQSEFVSRYGRHMLSSYLKICHQVPVEQHWLHPWRRKHKWKWYSPKLNLRQVARKKEPSHRSCDFTGYKTLSCTATFHTIIVRKCGNLRLRVYKQFAWGLPLTQNWSLYSLLHKLVIWFNSKSTAYSREYKEMQLIFFLLSKASMRKHLLHITNFEN